MNINTLRNENIETNKNAIDLIKFICAILVVSIHVPPLSTYNETLNFVLVQGIAKFAVPLFFISSGYLFFNKIKTYNGTIITDKKNSKLIFKFIKKLSLIYAFWTIFYLFWLIPFWANGGYLTLINAKGYILSIFTNGSYYHLWYITALIYGLIFSYFVLSLFKVRSVMIMAILFYFIGIFAYSYRWIGEGIYIVDTFLEIYGSLGSISLGVFRAFPFLMIGYIFSKYKFNISIYLSIFLCGIFIVLIGGEIYLLKTFSANTKQLSYIILTAITSLCIFNLVLKIKVKDNKKYIFLRNMSSIIYFAHPMFVNIFGMLWRNNNIENSVLFFLSVVFGTYIFGILLIKINSFKYINKLNIYK